MIGIYAITHVESGRCYIGSSIAIERRFLEQMHLDARKPNVYNADGPVDCPWRGKKRSPEQSAKLSAARTGKPHPHTPEQRAKIIASNKSRAGKKMPQKAVEKMRQSKIGVKIGPFSAETRAKMSIVAKARQYSQETCHKMSVGKIGKKMKPMSPETLKRRAERRRVSMALKKSLAS